jgi:hypothetical protein
MGTTRGYISERCPKTLGEKEKRKKSRQELHSASITAENEDYIK